MDSESKIAHLKAKIADIDAQIALLKQAKKQKLKEKSSGKNFHNLSGMVPDPVYYDPDTMSALIGLAVRESDRNHQGVVVALQEGDVDDDCGESSGSQGMESTTFDDKPSSGSSMATDALDGGKPAHLDTANESAVDSLPVASPTDSKVVDPGTANEDVGPDTADEVNWDTISLESVDIFEVLEPNFYNEISTCDPAGKEPIDNEESMDDYEIVEDVRGSEENGGRRKWWKPFQR